MELEAGFDALRVTAPSWRRDVDGPADLVEEVIRIEGIDHVPSTPLSRVPGVARPTATPEQKLERRLRRTAAARGLNEAVTWSFVSEGQAAPFGGGAWTLANPISEDMKVLKVAYALPSGGNAYIPLSELAEITLDTGPLFIYRERSQRYIPIKFSVRGRDLGGTVAEAQARVAPAVPLPPGYRIIWSGEFGNLEAAKDRLMIVVPVTLLLIFVLLYSLFNTAYSVYSPYLIYP
nr:efflux RND transporter permease subunit [Escherichia coli]